MKKKIFLYYLILIVIAVSITGIFISELAQKYYKYEVFEKLKNAAFLIRYQITIKAAKSADIDYNGIAKTYAVVLGSDTRITVIDFSGKVLGESNTNFLEMGNHLDRKEVKEAIAGQIGSDIRFSQTLRMDFQYIAISLKELSIVIRVSVPLTQLNEINRMTWYYTIIGILIGLISTMFFALKFSYSITSPVHGLVSVSKDISGGDYSKRVDIRSQGELGEIGDSFNKMALKLEKTVADLTDKNLRFDSIINRMIDGIIAVDTNLKITFVNAAANRLFNIDDSDKIYGANIMEVIRNNKLNNLLSGTIEKNMPMASEITIDSPDEKTLQIYTNTIKSADSSKENSGGVLFIHDITNLRKLEQIRTDFVSNVTHELKTPLTSIRGFIETLRGGAIKDIEVAGKFLDIIDIEAERLSNLINDVLQLSEIEIKQKDINMGIYDVKPIVDEVVSILQGTADKRNIKVEYEVDDNVKIPANRDRIKQMMINLVDNAIKYNIDKGSVFIKVRKDEGKIIFTVKDTGIGIAPEHQSRIFERFYRVDRGRSRSMGGTGLGLSIVRHIVNLYNGSIKLDSKPGKGSEFTIQLPV